MLNYTLYYLDSTLYYALSTIATDMHACYDNKCYCMHAMLLLSSFFQNKMREALAKFYLCCLVL